MRNLLAALVVMAVHSTLCDLFDKSERKQNRSHYTVGFALDECFSQFTRM